MQSPMPLVVILATGGTIAGTAAAATDTTGYRAGALPVDALVAGVPALAGQRLEAESVAAIDSKDMDAATWQRLARRVALHLARPEVAGIVITHGTDTLEETAYFLQRVLAPSKPVMLTAAMRPATALSADGPANLHDAVTVAGTPGARGVGVVFGGAVWAAVGLRKVHTLRTDAFAASDSGPVARLEGGVLRRFRDWPAGAALRADGGEAPSVDDSGALVVGGSGTLRSDGSGNLSSGRSKALPAAPGEALGLVRIEADPDAWPRVEIVLNHAGADGRLVDAAVEAGAAGIVVAGTGHGSVSVRLAAALERAREAGVRVARASRCAFGPVLPHGEADDEAAGELSAVQARVELQLALLAERG